MSAPTSPTVLRGQVVTPGAALADGVVVLDGDTIAWVGQADDATAAGWGPALAAAGPAADPAPEDRGGYLLPGLVDLHCHGGGGASFPDAETAAEAMAAVAEHRRHGTTSLVASLVTAAPGTLRARVEMLAGLAAAGELAGIHLEGPFLSTARCGAQDPALIMAPDPALTTELLALGDGHVVTMTLAPEHPGNRGPDGVAARLAAGGALPSWGHTDAGPGDTRAALAESAALLAETAALRVAAYADDQPTAPVVSEPAAAAGQPAAGRPDAAAGQPAAAQRAPRSARPTVTHLFNGMRPWHHRDPGPVGEVLAAARRGQAVVELIGDGTHLHPAVVREVYELVGRENAVLVTDAMAAAGMPDGSYRLGSMDVVVADGVARLAGGGSIAGGTAHLLDVVRTTVAGGVPLVDAVYMAATGPAGVLGTTRVGALEAGRRADVVRTDADLRPVQVLRGGVAVQR
ncbi:amidohydrolase family protein [Georgenia sp. TF02-10]|uniref:N-acetylglucosamine-6-phosphate deacetylase n=1 Tax=Georgenia sp. TF02-10 TaxID=2917725 RepID=UPI001FA6ACBF|nr:amidohydrolase family protein [Georgenia sp. TF02-10]UNX53970.1 amidohydrolase family protein [Georgenia sp. TF02-10]